MAINEEEKKNSNLPLYCSLKNVIYFELNIIHIKHFVPRYKILKHENLDHKHNVYTN